MPLRVVRQAIDQFLERTDYELAIKRINNDVQSDFIYAPHLSIIFKKAADELGEFLSNKLQSEQYNPRLPINLEVPKSNEFTRPGSILYPCERLAYQAAVDIIAPEAERALDRSRVFSYELLEEDPNGYMFKPADECYGKFDERKLSYLENEENSEVLYADVSCYFERLNQHELVNSLSRAGCDELIVKFLDRLLSAFTQRDSRGIVQGIYPSDCLGSFYLSPIDTQFEVEEIPSIRYVDDIYVFLNSPREARFNRIQLSQRLRKLGLNLNELKTKIFPAEELIQEETEIDRMMESAKDEANLELNREDFYSSTISWDILYDDVVPDEVEVSAPELEATKRLFNQTAVSTELRDKIDRRCLRNFEAAQDESAVDYVLNNFVSKPHMAQRYARYLKRFIKRNSAICEKVEQIFLEEDFIYDFQLHWLYALLECSSQLRNETVVSAIRHLQDPKRSVVIRAVSAILIGKFGSSSQRGLLKSHYEDEASSYVRAAIIYAAKHFPQGERNICFTTWRGHDEIFPLVVEAARRTIDED